MEDKLSNILKPKSNKDIEKDIRLLSTFDFIIKYGDKYDTLKEKKVNIPFKKNFFLKVYKGKFNNKILNYIYYIYIVFLIINKYLIELPSFIYYCWGLLLTVTYLSEIILSIYISSKVKKIKKKRFKKEEKQRIQNFIERMDEILRTMYRMRVNGNRNS